jgi:hypothetical protein
VGKKDRNHCLNNLPIRGILIAIKKAKKESHLLRLQTSLDFQIYLVFFVAFLAGAFLAAFFLSGIAVSFL